MGILTVLTGVWILNYGKKLKETKNINEFGCDPERNIKDKDEYIKLFSNMYFVNGTSLIIFGIFEALDKLFFHISFKALLIIIAILFVCLFIEIFVINKKKRKFLY
ncbi:Uncharacterised protein [uncultured Clostridium sp.]|nr:Uncharacterised protein [uncultured Clostridium sp.]SCJ07388.1 Uncharacterised protein [uncultured Clostridium sp.]